MMKRHLLAASMAVFLCANVQAQDILTGDTRLACEAVLCLSSGVRPGECQPALNKYFSIWDKKPHKMIQKRIDFLNLCPAANEKGMPELISAIGNGAGRCDADYLNTHNKRTYRERVCTYTGIGRFEDNATCEVVTRTVISNTLPKYCGIYQNHEWTYQVGVKYVGTPESGGKWAEAKDYDRALQEYNDTRQLNTPKSRFGSRITREILKDDRQ